MRTWIVSAVLCSTFFIAASKIANACPFCAPPAQTLSEEIAGMDVVIITDLLQATPFVLSDDGQELPKSKFKVVRVVKGESLVKVNQIIEISYIRDAKNDSPFLIMGIGPNDLMWSTPLRLSESGCNYVPQLLKLPKEGSARLEFFQQYLENPDQVLANDAYDEFAKSPYTVVQALKPKMERAKLVRWIRSPNTSVNRRRLYLTMLGVCGGPEEVPMLEQMLQSSNPNAKAGLDALIACYLTLKGPEGMPLIENLYLKNSAADLSDTYAAIAAIRFHGTEAVVIPKEQLTASLRYVLDRPEIADLVIPDLVKWEDWTVMDKMVQLFKTADQRNSWIRVPVVNYLRACPKAEAQRHIEELERIDPDAVKRAKTFFTPGGGPPKPAD